MTLRRGRAMKKLPARRANGSFGGSGAGNQRKPSSACTRSRLTPTRAEVIASSDW